jgi:site-specific recombinase XerD
MTLARTTTNLPAIPMLDAPLMRDTLTQGEYETFRDALTNWRDRLICMVLRNTGLRINEVLGLQVRSCKLPTLENPASILLIQRSKKRGQAETEPIYINPNLGVQLKTYIQVANKGSSLKPTDKVFNIKARGLRTAFEKAGITALGRPVQPKEFRSLFVQTMVDGGVDMATASKMVGHTDIRTTQKHYYTLSAVRRQMIGEGIPV